MDPISIVVAAVVAGASAALKDTAGQAVKDMYSGLVALMRRRFGGHTDVTAAIEKADNEPAAAGGELERALRSAGITADDETVRTAQQLLAISDPEGTHAGKYQVTITHSKGVVVGDHATVTMTFGADE